MASLSAEEVREQLAGAFPGIVVPSAPAVPAEAAPPAKHGTVKPNFLATNDTVVTAEGLVDAAIYLRDTLGYGYLSDIAVVDFLADGVFEVGYRFYHPEGGESLVLKVRVPRESPDVPSLTPVWPGAHLHEREGYDLYGINFVGHPYLQRIYMWDEFEGFPMRKDFPKQGDKYLDEE
ncbi:MAG: NADH-quinone oxidoreductase subunit C [Chloroflexaceae bacterium]|jgi:NADH-quinone oxidoreductase subunit C|nr:NADH-quinone oxidoreductase subunit C [Chloroflexaceae bacterium]